MNFKSLPISYSKVNPLGQLIIGLEDGTIFNSGSVVGPTGKLGPTGPTGHFGPTGPIGLGISKLYTMDDGNLYCVLENKTTLNAGKLPYVQGPTGKNGASIVKLLVENDNTLVAVTSDYKNLIAGKINTIRGPTGPNGKMGLSGKSFVVKNIYLDDSNQLNIVDSDNKIYNCGNAGYTGPTGPVGYWDKTFIDKNGHLILLYKNKFLDAGYIIGPTGPVNTFKNIQISDNGDLLFTDEMNKEYNAGKIPLNDEINILKKELKILREHINSLESKLNI